jgi:hypothetical protein
MQELGGRVDYLRQLEETRAQVDNKILGIFLFLLYPQHSKIPSHNHKTPAAGNTCQHNVLAAHKTQHTKRSTQNAAHKTQHTKRRTQNAGHKTQDTKRRTQNAGIKRRHTTQDIKHRHTTQDIKRRT